MTARCASLHVVCLSAALSGFFGAVPGIARALDVPALQGRVNDLAGLLDAGQAQALEHKLQSYEAGSGHQLALLTVPSLEGDSLEDFSIRVVEQWKLGKAGEDDGLLMLVAKEDRKMRIEVGYGLEGDVTDALCSRIIRDVMQPAFRAGNFFGGIDQAFGLLIRAAGGESVEVPRAHARRSAPSLFRLIFWGLVAMFFFVPMFGRRRRGGFFFLGGPGFGGGYGGGFGGGGFGGGGFSGGGGGFGGGGASGGW